jgi:hypothetical protein
MPRPMRPAPDPFRLLPSVPFREGPVPTTWAACFANATDLRALPPVLMNKSPHSHTDARSHRLPHQALVVLHSYRGHECPATQPSQVPLRRLQISLLTQGVR